MGYMGQNAKTIYSRQSGNGDLKVRIKLYNWEQEMGDKFKLLISDVAVFLPSWVDEVCIWFDPSQDNTTTVSFKKQYRRMDLYVSSDIAILDSNDICDIVLHEAAHAYNADICMCLDRYLKYFIPDDKDRELLNDIMNERIEEQTQDLTESFIRLYKERKDSK